jgi:hypothetical protein
MDRIGAMRADRIERILVAALGALVIGVATSLTAEAVATDQGVDDSCGIPNPPVLFYPTGPLAFWHEATYSGGPVGTDGVCTMYTLNVQEYTNYSDDNTSYW